MNLTFLERKDFWSGVMLIAIGGTAVFIARNYEYGSSLRMGPGYFPVVLGGLLIAFGVLIGAKGFRSDAESESVACPPHPRSFPLASRSPEFQS